MNSYLASVSLLFSTAILAYSLRLFFPPKFFSCYCECRKNGSSDNYPIQVSSLQEFLVCTSPELYL